MLLNLSKDELLCILGLLPQEVRCRTIPLLCKDLARVLRSSGTVTGAQWSTPKPIYYMCMGNLSCSYDVPPTSLHDALHGLQGSCTGSWRWT